MKREKFVWYNTALSSKFRMRGVLYGKYIDNISNATIERIIKSGEQGAEISFISASEIADENTEIFLAKGYRVVSKSKIFYITIFEDITEVKKLYARLEDEETLIAYAMIDNLDELMQYVQELYANASSDVEAILRRHMEKVGGVLRDYGA